MKMYYVSYPFTGDEKKNRKEARKFTAMLKKAYPQYIFINPLDAMRYTTGLPYGESLKQCIELLLMCDGIIVTGNWQGSEGCARECLVAVFAQKEITQLKDWLQVY